MKFTKQISNMKYILKYIILLFLLLTPLIVLINTTSNINTNTNSKTDNPYKTKERIDEEDEFDSPELLDTNINSNNNKDSQEPDQEEIIDETIQNQSKEESKQAEQKNIFGGPVEITDEWRFYLFSFYECLMLAFLIIYILNCIVGKTNNDKISKKWLSSNNTYFINNYAHIGTGTDYNIDKPLFADSYNNYKYYASGRTNIRSMLVSLDLIKRQDLVSSVSNVIMNDKDRIIYEIALNPSTNVPHVLCLCRKKEIKHMKKTYSDIEYITKSYEPAYMSKNLVMTTEDSEITDKIFQSKNVFSLYENIEEYIDLLYLTDRQSYSKENHTLFISFYPPSNAKGKNFQDINLFVHALCDKICEIEFNNNKRKQCDKIRDEYEEYRLKIQVEKSKEEDEKNGVVSKKDKAPVIKKNLTRDQLIKLEEKEKKKKMEKERSRYTKVMKH